MYQTPEKQYAGLSGTCFAFLYLQKQLAVAIIRFG